MILAWRSSGLHLDNAQILVGFQYIMSAVLLGQRSHKVSLSSMLLLAVMLCHRFVEEEKKAAWQTGNVNPQASDVFSNLSVFPLVIRDEDMNILQKFVITLYDRSSPATDVDEVRLDLFARKQKSNDAIPPTRANLVQHTKCAAYQAGRILDQATIRQIEFDSPAEWGWSLQEANTIMAGILNNILADCCELPIMWLQDRMQWQV